jgi:DNA-binding SARP family transcriptional activator
VLVVDFGLLGPLTVSDGARPVTVSAPRQRVLLATLLLSAGRVVSVDTLAEVLWDGEPPAGARGAMHSAIQRLRSALGQAGAGLIGTRASRRHPAHARPLPAHRMPGGAADPSHQQDG